MDEDLTEIQVRFVTKLDAPVPDTTFSLPVRLQRYGLSGVVNHLLAQDPPRPYDFLIDGSFLRSSLAQYLVANKVSAESVLEIEYIEALPEPQTLSSNPHPDWVSAVDGSQSRFIASGCYDGNLRIWPGVAAAASAGSLSDQEPLALGAAHSAAIKGVCWVNSAEAAHADVVHSCVTASKDRTIRVWQFSPDSDVCANIAVGRAHADSVEAVSSAPASNKFCSVGWDGKLMVWELPEVEDALKKKRKTLSGVVTQEMMPLCTMEGHSNAVSAVCWPDVLAIYTGSHDHSIKHWDPEATQCVRTWLYLLVQLGCILIQHAKQVITDVKFSLVNNMIATSHNDKLVRIWDPRSKYGEVIKLSLASHQQWVSSVAWSTTDANLLVSGSYDGTVKMWDLRSSMPLHTLQAHTDKTLAVDFHAGGSGAGVSLVSGGADNQLQLHRIVQ